MHQMLHSYFTTEISYISFNLIIKLIIEYLAKAQFSVFC